MVNDSIGDFIIQLKNASAVGKPSVSLPYSALKHSVSEKLKICGFVKAVGKRGKKARKFLDIELAYSGTEKRPKIDGVLRVSKPGRRVYLGIKDIRRSGLNNTRVLVLSTPKGILTDDEARKEHVGGEALFHIW